MHFRLCLLTTTSSLMAAVLPALAASSESPAELPAADWALGLRDPIVWQADARWIGLPMDIFHAEAEADEAGVPIGKWLWNNEGSRFYLRKKFQVPEGQPIQSASLRIEADNRFQVWVNGQPVELPKDVKSWRDLPALDITSLVRPGENLINVRALETDTPDWFVSALRGGLRVDFADPGKPPLLEATDSTWKMTEITWSKMFLGAGFDEKAWMTPEFTDEVAPEICQDLHPRMTRRSWMGRREFEVKGPVTGARVAVTAHGLYELFLNGKKVGRDLLTPDHMPKSYQYQTYDITDLLKPGINCLAAITGGGFANTQGHSGLTPDPPLLLLQMEIDGPEKSFIVSDPTWKVAPSPLVEDSIQFGERYDARLEQPGWKLPEFDDSAWVAAAVTEVKGPVEPQECETIRLIAEEKARTVTEPVPGVFLYDFGVNSSGRVRLKVQGAKSADRIEIRYGESLGPDGLVSNGPYRNVIFPDDPQARYKVRNIDVYVCRGEPEEVYEPAFAYTGFRYAQIIGYPGTPGEENLIKRVFHTATPERGTFSCSDPLINDIWAVASNSWSSNLHGAPTDCPTREKQHWEDVGVQNSRTAMWYMESDRVLTRWMTKGARLGRAVGWEDMDIEIPWVIYVFSGNAQIIEQHYPVMRALVEKRLKRLKNGIYDGSESHQWLDHTSLDKTDREIFCSAFLWRNLDLMQRMATVIGKTEDASQFAAQRDQLGEAIQARLYDPAARQYRNGTQTAQLLPLAFGLVPESERAGVVNSLVANIEKRGGKLSTGMTGAKFLLPVLSANGHHTTALKLAQSTGFPSWGNWLAKGGTAMAETWDALDRPYPGKRNVSFNHPNYGSIGEWFFEYLAGIQPDEEHPGFTHFFIRPEVEGDLTWVQASFRSPRGPISSAWKKEGETLTMNVVVPPGTTATVRIPGSEVKPDTAGKLLDRNEAASTYLLDPGTYRFSSRLKK